jgi:hypothetical protein
VLQESYLAPTGAAPSDPGRESKELSLEVETDGAGGFAWPLEVDDGASLSRAFFFTSFACPSTGLQGWTIDVKLKLFFISWSFFACCYLFPISWFSALCIKRPY